MADEKKAPAAPPATAPPAPPAPTILVPKGGSFAFRVTYPHWSHLPKGTIRTETQLGGPDNVRRLIEAGCVTPHVGG